MKKRIKVFTILGLCFLMILGSATTSYCWTTRQIAAFEAKWGSNWIDMYTPNNQEFHNYVNYNNYLQRTGQGGWDNPQDPPAGWSLSSTSTSTPSTTTPSKPACDHDYEMQITTQPTCVEEGVATYTCTKCGNKYTQALEPTGVHDYVAEVTKEPTCTEAGETTYTCSMCGDSYTEEIEKLEHEYTSEVTKKVTCTEEGETTYTCSVCGDTYTEPIPARGHSEGSFEVTTPNGWFTEGEQVQKCVSCGAVLATEVIPSTFPIWYLYVAIGFAVVFVALIIGLVFWMKKKK